MCCANFSPSLFFCFLSYTSHFDEGHSFLSSWPSLLCYSEPARQWSVILTQRIVTAADARMRMLDIGLDKKFLNVLFFRILVRFYMVVKHGILH